MNSTFVTVLVAIVCLLVILVLMKQLGWSL
jgi:hypothetical protein